MIGRVQSLCRMLLLLLLVVVVACADEQTGPETVIARIDGEPILLSEVEGRAAWRLHRARLDVYMILERETEKLIDERILDRAARASGLDADLLLKKAEAEAPAVTDADVDRYLELHPADVPIAQARTRIRHYLGETRRIERRLAFLETLRAAAEIEIALAPPERPRSQLDSQGAPARGAETAQVEIVHFADLSAADSARSARTLAALQREFPEAIRILHRSLPRERDELGLRTAQFAAAAQADGIFWEVHDRLAQAGGVRQAAQLESIANALDRADLLASLANDRDSLLRVKQDLDHARDAGVERAPTLFVNGRYFMGLDGEAALRKLVLEELGAQSAR